MIVWRCHLCPWSGYGRASFALTAELIRLGVDVHFDATMDTNESFTDLPAWVRERLAIPDPRVLTLQFGHPDLPAPRRGRVVHYTMWESTGVKRAWVRQWNRGLALLTPSRFNAVTFTAAGATGPVAVVPLGLDPEVFHDRDRPPPGDAFRIGMAGRMQHGGVRKGILEGIAAFRDAFPGRSDVALEVKCLADDPVPDFGDPRITIHRDFWPADRLAAWYRTLDIFLHPSQGEGWGCHLLEAMACGTPPVSVIWSGEADFLRADSSYPLDHTLEPGTGPYLGLGVMARPTPESLVRQLRAAAADRATAVRKGIAAARRARTFTWESAARHLLNILRPLGVSCHA